jgi:hypothetical protein
MTFCLLGNADWEYAAQPSCPSYCGSGAGEPMQSFPPRPGAAGLYISLSVCVCVYVYVCVVSLWCACLYNSKTA